MVSKSFLIAFFISIGISLSFQTPVTHNYTENLLRQAKSAEINAFIRKNDNQCENFYGEVCGNWKLTYPGTFANPKTSYLGQLEQFYTSKCLDLMKKGSDEKNYNKMLKNFFQSCSMEPNKVKRDLESVLRSIVNFEGGWPNISSPSWYESDYDWLKVVAESRRRLGVDIFIGLDISPNLNRFSQRIQIGAPKLPLGGRSVYLDDDYVSQRDDYIHQIALKLRTYYTDMPETWADEVAAQVLEVEQKLSKGLDEKILPQKNTTRQQTVSQMTTAYSRYIDVNRYLTLVLNRSVTVNVYESPLNYMTNLMEVIETTPKLTIANYTMWRVLERLDFAGKQNQENNDIWCIEKVKKYFKKHLEDMFYRAYNAKQFGDSLNNLFEEIKKGFQEEIAGLKWMSSTSRYKALEKLQEMKLAIEHYNDETLQNEVQEINQHISSDNYYNNMLIIQEWKTKNELATLQPKNQIPTILPNYIHTENKIEIPVIFMQQRVLWDPVYPNALKYSTVGVLLAQQMLRGFFNKGSTYDKRGDPNPWWDNETKVAYGELAECFQKQYTNYKFQGKSVSDPETLLKAIADAGALKIAYHTYHNWMNNAKADVLGKESLPNVDYKPHQFFFLGYGQMFCADYHISVSSFTELPERLRVNGAVANLEEFGKEFECQQNTNMNPKNKCTLF